MIRKAQEKDVADILAIYNDAILNTTAIYMYKPQTLEEKIDWFYAKEKAGQPVLVWEEDGRAVGFATYGLFRTYPAYKYTVEHSIYVDRNYRGRGIAFDLMKALIEEAAANEVRTMVAVVEASNAASAELHKSLGFTYAGELHDMGFKFGMWRGIAFYEMHLAGPEIPVEE